MLSKVDKPPIPAWVGDRRAAFVDDQWVILFTNARKARKVLGDIQTEIMSELDVVVDMDRVPGKGDMWYIGEVN